jgi:hypothetical protein
MAGPAADMPLPPIPPGRIRSAMKRRGEWPCARFGMQCDFAQLIKNYESSQDQTLNSPAKIISAEKLTIFGEPEEDRISTSHIERFNLTVRTTLR